MHIGEGKKIDMCVGVRVSCSSRRVGYFKLLGIRLVRSRAAVCLRYNWLMGVSWFSRVVEVSVRRRLITPWGWL